MSTNYIDQITDTAGTTQDISESDSTRIFRATCSTSASTAAKVATLQTSNKNFSLTAGVRVAVTFTYGNSATTPTLRVDGSSTGTAKTIVFPTAVATKSTGNGTTYNTWGPYETIVFTYDGTYWVNSGSALGIYNAYALANSKGSGTVTSVGITNGGGLSISGSPITTSGSITVSHSNSVTAQTTQAVYPIKIDAQGHVSDYGSAVTIPTKTSDLTNDSGFITTDSDEKVKATALTFDDNTYYPIFGHNNGNAETKNYTNAFSIGASSTYNRLTLNLGDTNVASKLRLFKGDGNSNRTTDIIANLATDNRTITLPDKTGTVALTSDIPTVPTKTSDLTNDSGFITSYVDTKNTAGSTDTSSKIYLIGATSQAANPQTYSNSELYFHNGLYSSTSVDSLGGYSYFEQHTDLNGNIYNHMGITDDENYDYGIHMTTNSISISGNGGLTGLALRSSGTYIYNLVTPTNNTDAANKKYVDDAFNAVVAAQIVRW